MDNFQSLLRNYDFQSEDIARLKSIHSLAEDSLEAFLTLFYSRIFSFRHANQFLSHKNIIEMHRQKIKIWFLELFGGVYDDEYFEKLRKISQTHVRIALPNHYVNTALHIVRSFMRDLLIQNHRLECLESVDKIIDINIDVLSGFYTTVEQTDMLQTVQIIHRSLQYGWQGVVPYVQPIFNTQTGMVEKYECLMRLKEEDDIYTPHKFLEIARKTGHYCELSRAMIDKTLHYFSTREESFCINLSFDDMKSQRTKLFLEEKLSTFSNPSRITFEIVESQAFDNMTLLSEFIEFIRSYGCLIAIDDFGSGYSNFNQILSLSPDILKIDGSLIKDIDSNAKHQTIVENIQSLAHKLGILTVAEFVHSETIMEHIQEMGIDYAQGFYLGVPRDLVPCKS